MVRGVQVWRFRPDNAIDTYDPYTVYAGYPNIFSMKVHHGGIFTSSPSRKYVNGKIQKWVVRTFRDEHKCGRFKDVLWKAATATTKVEFNNVMNELKVSHKQAHEWLSKISPEHWSRSHFSGNDTCFQC
ncbi:hypothetical protein CTI12_AA361340 [Artemisia annua]|uniref:Uncharacterized protein n=1 Tax=Artemisia annua TaxID=35608 RepID=A0A2U1MN56_ARTAN|nr:hypothetical protein CTI12_AA361340 [Artemisia annua]